MRRRTCWPCSLSICFWWTSKKTTKIRISPSAKENFGPKRARRSSWIGWSNSGIGNWFANPESKLDWLTPARNYFGIAELVCQSWVHTQLAHAGAQARTRLRNERSIALKFLILHSNDTPYGLIQTHVYSDRLASVAQLKTSESKGAAATTPLAVRSFLIVVRCLHAASHYAAVVVGGVISLVSITICLLLFSRVEEVVEAKVILV